MICPYFLFESEVKTSMKCHFFKWTKCTLTAFIGLIGYSSIYIKIRGIELVVHK